ncbi:hypothetical protein KJ785_00900 [Patescibacteria group bacterium]|nr:hypothetical protein [Patescibacteria group bacterium]
MSREKRYPIDSPLFRASVADNSKAKRPVFLHTLDKEGKLQFSKVVLDSMFDDDTHVVNELFDNFLDDASQPLPELRKLVKEIGDEDKIDDKIKRQIKEAFYIYLEKLGYSIQDKDEN